MTGLTEEIAEKIFIDIDYSFNQTTFKGAKNLQKYRSKTNLKDKSFFHN